VAGIFDLVEAVWRAYALRRERRAAARELHALDDRTLRDIGVSRSEIEWVVRGPHWTRARDVAIGAKRCRQRQPTVGSVTTAKSSVRHATNKHAA
jgi:uncharacterized protein YjiS (DUF1127 family)